MDNYAEPGRRPRARPGDMSHAQNALELVYELRGSAMDEIADKMSTALGDVGAEQGDGGDRQADAEAARRRRRSTHRSSRPEIDGVLADNGIEGDDVPKSVFLPDGTKWLDEGDGQRGARLGQRRERRRNRRASTASA